MTTDCGAETESMVKRLQSGVHEVGGGHAVHYIARVKVPGVPHHAKAGNMNHALLQSGMTRGQFVVVYDCDMVCMPQFLLRTIPHFYHPSTDGRRQGMVVNDKIGYVQVRSRGKRGSPCFFDWMEILVRRDRYS